MEHESQIVAILRTILERLEDPDDRLQMAASDSFRSHFLITQMSAIMIQQRDQIQALADAIGILIGRFLEHNRRANDQHEQLLTLIQALAHGVGEQEIAEHAKAARAILETEAAERLAEIELAADQAKELLSVARMDASALVRKAVDHAQKEITTAADVAREKLTEDQQESP